MQSLERVVGMPHLRRVRTVTNLSRAPRELLLQVCSPESDSEELLFFRPHDPLATHNPGDLLGAEWITTTALAWALARTAPVQGKRPPGEANDLATRLREEWQRRGLIEVKEGARNAKLMRLREGVQQ